MGKTALEVAKALPLDGVQIWSLRSDCDDTAKVLCFHQTYGNPIHRFGNTDRQFTHMDNARVALRLGFHIEELKELFKEGFGIDVDIQYQVPFEDGDGGMFFTRDIEAALHASDHKAGGFAKCRSGKEVMDALADYKYFGNGFAIEMGYDPRPVDDEVHASNMTKLGDDGKPIYREDGKVLKGPNYVEPNIEAALGWE